MLDSLDTLIAFVLIMLVVSLLITIAVQMVSALLNLRGLNLAQGLKRTFGVIVPNSDQQAKKLANYILKGRFLSDSFLPDWGIFKYWRHTTAIRPQEAFDAIHRIAIGQEPADADLRDHAQALLVALGVDGAALNTAAERITNARQIAQDFTQNANAALQSVVTDASTQATVATALNRVLTTAQDSLTSVTNKLNAYEIAAASKAVAAAGAADAAYEKFQYWVDTCEQRAQQWFTLHTRMIAAVAACVFAFWLQLDAVDIFKLVSSNRVVREKLVAQSAGISSQADKVFADSKSVLQKAYDNWLDKSEPDVQATLKAANIKVDPNDTREKVTARIKNALGPAKDANLKSFNETVDNVALDTLKDKAGDYAAVKADFENTGFDFLPKNGRGRWGNSWSNGWGDHLWGVIFSVGLLSLGAPFWYNVLKNLVSLRSSVAQNISKEREQAQKEGDADNSTAPPPTLVPLPPAQS